MMDNIMTLENVADFIEGTVIFFTGLIGVAVIFAAGVLLLAAIGWGASRVLKKMFPKMWEGL